MQHEVNWKCLITQLLHSEGQQKTFTTWEKISCFSIFFPVSSISSWLSRSSNILQQWTSEAVYLRMKAHTPPLCARSKTFLSYTTMSDVTTSESFPPQNQNRSTLKEVSERRWTNSECLLFYYHAGCTSPTPVALYELDVQLPSCGVQTGGVVPLDATENRTVSVAIRRKRLDSLNIEFSLQQRFLVMFSNRLAVMLL